MISKTIIKLLSNAKSGLNKVYKKIIDTSKEEEALSREEVKSVTKEIRAIRKQLLIVEEEID